MTTQSENLSTRNERNENYVRDLRELADWLERHPEIDPPSMRHGFYFLLDKGDLARYAKALEHAEKDVNKDYFIVRRRFGGIVIEALVSRETVCERVVVGTRTIAAVPEYEEDIVEWRCPESVLDAPSQPESRETVSQGLLDDGEIPF